MTILCFVQTSRRRRVERMRRSPSLWKSWRWLCRSVVTACMTACFAGTGLFHIMRSRSSLIHHWKPDTLMTVCGPVVVKSVKAPIHLIHSSPTQPSPISVLSSPSRHFLQESTARNIGCFIQSRPKPGAVSSPAVTLGPFLFFSVFVVKTQGYTIHFSSIFLSKSSGTYQEAAFTPLP